MIVTLTCLAQLFVQVPHNQDRPPGPALSPAEALKHFKTRPGFKVELFAAEPDVVNPVAMTFDRRGRVWITESLEYPRRSAGPGKDRIRILEDTDGDGKADQVKVFADGLNIPSGIIHGYGGVFVCNAPDLLFLKDTDGDDKADTREVLFTGFGRDDTHELPSALIWGPDGWLYGLNGVFNYSKITHQGKTHEFTCAVWRYHPRTRKFELFAEGTSNPWGLDYNQNGDFFVSACVIDHLWHITETGYYHRQGGPYPPFTWKIESIVNYKHQKAAYCGLCYYDAESYPEEYRGTLFMGNIHGNCINNDALERHGASYRGRAQPDFLSTDDAWFMPVVQKVGPDGCLWVVDWYDRYHCYQDANRDPAGIDRLKGRIYRVTYNGTPMAKKFDLAKATSDELRNMVGHSNNWISRQAVQILTERDVQIVPKASTDDSLDNAWLAASGAAKIDLASMLSLPSPQQRSWGVRIVGELGKDADSSLKSRLMELVNTDNDPVVLTQLAIAAPKVFGRDAVPQLLKLAAKSHTDPSELLPRIIWRNLEPLLDGRVGEVIAFAKATDLKQSPMFGEILSRIVERSLVLNKKNPGDVAPLVDFALSANDKAFAARIMESIGRSLIAGELSDAVIEQLKELHFKNIAELAKANDGGDPRTNAALTILARFEPNSISDAAAVGSVLQSLVISAPERASGLAAGILAKSRNAGEARDALTILMKAGRPESSEVLINTWAKLPSEAAPQAIDALASRPAWAKALLAAVVAKKIPTAAVNANQIRRIRDFNDEELTKQIVAIWGQIRDGRNPDRERVVQRYLNLVQRGGKGDPEKGVKVYERLCAQCHQFKGKGSSVGPSLNENGRTGLPLLVSNLLDPNLVIGKDYQARTVVLDDGRVLSGLVAEDSPTRVVLKLAGDKQEVIPRDRMESMKMSDVSLMPEGQEKQMTDQEFRDLIAYLVN